MYLWSLKEEQYLNSFDNKQCSVFLGSDSLLMDNKNLSYWVNQDQTGFYVFSRNQGVPEAQWTRATRSNPGCVCRQGQLRRGRSELLQS